MSVTLQYGADFIGGMLESDVHDMDPVLWVASHEKDNLRYFEPSVRQNLTTNKSMRCGVGALFHHVATCCFVKLVPTTPNVLGILDEESEWPPNTRNFFQRGGKVASAVQAAFDWVVVGHKYLGFEDFEKVLEEEVAPLKACRNDLEVEFARRQYLMSEEGSG